MAPPKKHYKAMNFGELMVASSEEAASIARGELTPTKVSRVTARNASVEPPPSYEPERVRAVREQLGLSQPVFARALNVSVGTVRGWEQGARMPDGPTRRLLQLAEEHPDAVLTSVHAAGTARAKPGAPRNARRARV